MRTLVVLVFMLALVSSCVKHPSRNTQVVDDRPGVSFELLAGAPKHIEVFIDGISYGDIKQYLAGEGSLLIIDGPHQVELYSGGEVFLAQDVYLGAGSRQIIKVSKDEN